MKKVPFTVYFEIEEIQGKRFEKIHNLHYIAEEIYLALEQIDTIAIALPGGGQSKPYFSEHGAHSNLIYGCGVKPSFGDTPAQAMITGFNLVSSENVPAYAETQLISAGQVFTSSRPTDFNNPPSSSFESEVKALRQLLDQAVSDLGFQCTVYRLEYSGVRYGARGLHFPR